MTIQIENKSFLYQTSVYIKLDQLEIFYLIPDKFELVTIYKCVINFQFLMDVCIIRECLHLISFIISFFLFLTRPMDTLSFHHC